MNRQCILAGLAASLVVHGILFMVPSRPAVRQKTGPESAVAKAARAEVVVLPQVPREAPAIAKVARAPEVPKPTREPHARTPAKPERPATPPFKELFPPQAVKGAAPAAKQGDVAADESKERRDTIPELRLDISDAETVCRAVKYFGIRFAAIDGEENVVGEFRADSPSSPVPFRGVLSSYSNRVRRLPDDYLGGEAESFLKQKRARLYMLIPAPVDAAFSSKQREAIVREGRLSKDVHTTTGMFVKAPAGGYDILITGVE